MKVVQRFQTSDGVLHDDIDKAKRHAEKRYGDALVGIANELLEIQRLNPEPVLRRNKMAEYIDANLDEFLKLQGLKKDINKDIEPDEWDH